MSTQPELPDYLEFLNENQYSILPDDLKCHLNDFLFAQENLLLELYEAGADMRLIFDALWLIWDEELTVGSDATFFEIADSGLLKFDLKEPSVRAYKKGKKIDQSGTMPEWIEDILRQIEDGIVIREERFEIKGKFNITVKAELRNGNDMFIVKHSFSKPLIRPRKGRKGEQQSGFVMLLLSKHFSDMKIRGKYPKIAALINNFSMKLFRQNIGGSLNEDKVKQYVIRTKKKTGAEKWCRNFMTQRSVKEEQIPPFYIGGDSYGREG